jgi:hypothetical protein
MAKELQDMTEPELKEYFNGLMKTIHAARTPDTIGAMLIVFQTNGISQYAASIDPEPAPQALRELADRLEKRQTVKR